MRSVYLSLGADSDAEAERIYGLLSEGGEIFMPMQETFFAFRFAQLRDKFGSSWVILHERRMRHGPDLRTAGHRLHCRSPRSGP
jgi:PhnB protein